MITPEERAEIDKALATHSEAILMAIHVNLPLRVMPRKLRRQALVGSARAPVHRILA